MSSRQSHPAGARAPLPVRFWLQGGVGLPRSRVQLRALLPLVSQLPEADVPSPPGVREAQRPISAFALRAESDAGSAMLREASAGVPGEGRWRLSLPGTGR